MKKFMQLMTFLAFSLALLTACGPPDGYVRDTEQKPRAYKPKPFKEYPKEYEVNGESYKVLDSAEGFEEEGIASWYGDKFHGRVTSSGEVYDMYGRTAAHKTLPFNTRVKVTNLENGRTIYTRINDRGPFHEGRIIDLTYTLAKELGFGGCAKVRLEALDQVIEPTGGGTFALQVGAFTQVENAQRLAQDLKDSIEPVRVVEAWVNEQTFHRVRVGLYQSRAQAEKDLPRLKKLVGIDPMIVPLD